MANTIDGQDHKDKYFDTVKDLVTRNDHVQYGNSNILFFRNYNQCQFFSKMVKCQGQKVKYQHKDLESIRVISTNGVNSNG